MFVPGARRNCAATDRVTRPVLHTDVRQLHDGYEYRTGLPLSWDDRMFFKRHLLSIDKDYFSKCENS